MQIDEVDTNCTICYDAKSLFKFFKCTKTHYICIDCFNKLEPDRNKKTTCPTCKCDIADEFRPPSTLTKSELLRINIDNILPKYIFIHQNFILNFASKLVKINANNEITLHSLHGTPTMFAGMFICNNGFLYSYDEHNHTYHLAVRHNKFQFWDISRISINK